MESIRNFIYKNPVSIAVFIGVMMFFSYHIGKVIEHRSRPPVVYVKFGDFNFNLYKALEAEGIYLTVAQKKALAMRLRAKKQCSN